MFNRCSFAFPLAPCLLRGQAAAPELESDAGMVVTSQHLRLKCGAAILRQGGNAIDAAVAVGYALAVTHPCCGNLGGGGFMIIHFADGKNTFINFRERAPLPRARHVPRCARQGRQQPQSGWLSGGGRSRNRMGLETARQKYGTLARRY